MPSWALMLVSVVFPIAAGLIEWLASQDISERHHSHHDTFVVPSSIKRSLVIAMVFMCVTGIVMGWLCQIDVFEADPTVVLGFFVGFLAVAFVCWLLMRRYRVALYEDHMVVTPLLGKDASVRYADITSMEWTGVRAESGFRNLRIFVNGEKVTALWGGLDIEQILMLIDRFDVLGHASNS